MKLGSDKPLPNVLDVLSSESLAVTSDSKLAAKKGTKRPSTKLAVVSPAKDNVEEYHRGGPNDDFDLFDGELLKDDDELLKDI